MFNMINSFKITTISFGMVQLGLFGLWLWDSALMGSMFGLEILGERNLIPFFFLTLGLLSLVGSLLKEARPRIMFLLVILSVPLVSLFANMRNILAGEMGGLAFISASFFILGMVSLWNEGKYVQQK